MPSDERIFQSLTKPLGAFHSVLATTIEQLRAALEDQAPEEGTSSRSTGLDLGSFAAGRIDANKFAAVAAREAVALEPAAVDRIRRAQAVLTGLVARKNDLFRIEVAKGGDLKAAVASALAEIGRAFGAARVVELARTRRYEHDAHSGWLNSYAYGRWNPTERGMTPPLVVHVDGTDLQAEGLAEFLDGSTKLVLVVHGDMTPAPLARLVTPGVFVLQTKDEMDLDRFAAWDGPGVAALLSEGGIAWAHDPDAGPNSWDRIRKDALPSAWPTKPLGTISAFQQSEQLRQLQSLSTRPPAVVVEGAPAEAAAPADPVDKLASWLLSETDLSGLE